MYPIEIKIASKNGWSTPQEAKQIWGRYSREGITIHWWGDGSGANNHDNIVNYFLNQASRGIKSVNYVVSDNKITLMVSPDNVAWCSNAGNPTTISIEHQPTLGAEGYKKSGWLVWQLEQRYNRRLNIYPHSKWNATQCPGSINLNKIRQEADKWASGAYNPPVEVKPPTVTPPTVSISYTVLPQPVTYKVNKATDLWNFNSPSWSGFKSVKKLAKGEDFTVHAIADNHNVKAKYGVTKYSFDKKLTHGINMVDLDLPKLPEPPIPVPPPTEVEPEPEPSIPISVLEQFANTVKLLWNEMLNKFRKS